MVAAGPVREGIGGLFDGLVPAEVIAAYDRLRARDGCAKDQAEALVGGASLVAALTRWGMAHIQPHTPADPAWLRPASPDLALAGVLAGHQNRLARDQQVLLDGQQRLAEAQARFGTAMNGRFPAHLVAVVADRAAVSELSASLVNTAHRDWMTLENPHTEMDRAQLRGRGDGLDRGDERGVLDEPRMAAHRADIRADRCQPPRPPVQLLRVADLAEILHIRQVGAVNQAAAMR